MNHTSTLQPCLIKICQMQNSAFDRLAIQEACISVDAQSSASKQLNVVTEVLHLKSAKWVGKTDPSVFPALVCNSMGEWGVIVGQNASKEWIIQWWQVREHQWSEGSHQSLTGYSIANINLKKIFYAGGSPVYQLIRGEVFSHKKILFEAVLAGIAINLVALGTSFYTMQVYDRVVPTGASQTLYVLTIGVLLAIIYELFSKKVRSRLFDRLIDKVDQRLARSIYLRFLAVRIDQLPSSVGTLASQVRGYETVRNFMTSITTQLLVDAPFALMFALILAAIAGPLALIPLFFFLVSVSIGLYYRRKVSALASSVNSAVNFKVGLMVETIEGAESIKAGQGGWRMLSRWMNTTDESRSYERQMRNITEHSAYVMASFQQFSYILLVASGALLISRGEMTMGALIASSILSGRILAPVSSIPSHLMQWAHTKAALRGLDQLWELEDDHFGTDHPLILENIEGRFRLEDVEVKYGDRKALKIDKLHINAGEKIAILGPVGAGKTTLLRLLTGMYKPQQGRALLDDIDLSHIAKPCLAEATGYAQQEGRLFSGTLRDNLILGLIDPGDEKILNAARTTGLLEAVINAHPQGLQQAIFEGGTGLSGGQRQLVNLTRVFLLDPKIWLLDEPTASMDRNLEVQLITAMGRQIGSADTLVLVTHKPEMLELVERIIVVANQQIVMDGPKALVLEKMQQVAQKKRA
ncbi:MAG: ATP-binding cassette domain-containing protein [Pseudomonadales bacterium]|nr:ATP-binding cassette domain-containing protein [Pseudomonadales bacterium]NRA15274.1 ATP-binding cassette domain-containing protein [Oceanospirillaceae bacterium]